MIETSLYIGGKNIRRVIIIRFDPEIKI